MALFFFFMIKLLCDLGRSYLITIFFSIPLKGDIKVLIGLALTPKTTLCSTDI